MWGQRGETQAYPLQAVSLRVGDTGRRGAGQWVASERAVQERQACQ